MKKGRRSRRRRSRNRRRRSRRKRSRRRRSRRRRTSKAEVAQPESATDKPVAMIFMVVYRDHLKSHFAVHVLKRNPWLVWSEQWWQDQSGHTLF